VPTMDTSGGSNTGGVAIIRGSSAMPATVALASADLTLEGRQSGSKFGRALSALGNLGHETPARWELGVGAPNEDVGAFANAGVVYIFTGGAMAAAMGGTIAAGDATFEIQGEEDGAELQPAGPIGDLDRDGTDDLVVSSPFIGPSDQGRVYIMLSGL
jgi:hypothetical protein